MVNDPQLSPSAEDRMVLIEETGAVPGQQVELGLEVEPNITWWKALETYANGGLQIASIATQDNVKGPQCVRLPLVEMIAQGAFVVLAKAKLLGVHTDSYQLFIQEFESPGTRFTFLWGQDS